MCDNKLTFTIFQCNPWVFTVCRGFLLYFLMDQYIREFLKHRKYILFSKRLVRSRNDLKTQKPFPWAKKYQVHTSACPYKVKKYMATKFLPPQYINHGSLQLGLTRIYAYCIVALSYYMSNLYLKFQIRDKYESFQSFTTLDPNLRTLYIKILNFIGLRTAYMRATFSLFIWMLDVLTGRKFAAKFS